MKKLGFVIVNHREEFLHNYSIDGLTIGRVWSAVPDLAKLFKTRRQAATVGKQLEMNHDAWVMQLSETDTQYQLTCDTAIKPNWLTS